MNQLKPIAILGAGSWGTALALYLSRRKQQVQIWSIDRTEIEGMLADGENRRYLPDHLLPQTLKPVFTIEEVLQNVQDILMVVPSVGYRSTLEILKPFLKPGMRFISATKGIDGQTGQLMNEVVEDVLGEQYPFAVLSGPSFAREVAAGLPCAVMVASKQDKFVKDLMDRFNSAIFRTHPSNDVIGVELGGIIKNVIAIATGLFDGKALGVSARSAVITQGLHEIIGLSEKLGGKLHTMISFAGLGDLILTCSDDQSRNRRLGLAIGRGQTVTEAEAAIGQIVEGKRNAELVVNLAQKHQTKMPICSAVWDLLQGNLTPEKAIENIMGS